MTLISVIISEINTIYEDIFRRRGHLKGKERIDTWSYLGIQIDISK